MVDTVGSIEYIIEADTGDLLRAEKSVNASTDKISESFNKIDNAAKKTGTQMTKTAKSVKTGLAGVGRGAGQAGIQLQQFIGQIQGGQNAMLALSQQSADLGFVLGAPLLGAIVGISASIAGIFLPALFDSGKAVDELVEKMEKWKETIGLTREQADFLINKQKEENVVRAKSIAEYTKEISVIETQLENQRKALEGYDLEDKARKRLLEAQRKTQEELVKAQALRQSEIKLILEAGDKIDVYNGAVKEGTEVTKKQKEATEAVTESLTTQIIALTDGEEAAFRFATAQQLGLKVGEQIPPNIDKQISAFFRLKEAKEASIKADREAIKSQRERESLERQVSGVGVSPEQNLIARFARENELLRAAKEQEILTEAEFLTRKFELNKQHEEALMGLREKTNEQALINFESLENRAVGTLASIVTGAQTGEDAIKSLAASVLTELIGSLIRLGIQAVVGQTTAAAAGAATGATLAASYAPAAALASLASFGANAAPAAAAIASTTALTSSVALSGGLQYGGRANANSLYRVGEAGPEIFSSGGKNFMIPGENGQVISNNEINNAGTTQNNVSLTLNIDPRSPDEFSEQLVRNAPLLTNLIEKSINDRGRTL